MMISGGLTAAYNALVPEFEGHRPQGCDRLRTVDGNDRQRDRIRLQRGEPADVLIAVGYALGVSSSRVRSFPTTASISSNRRSGSR